jgi:serine/threonine protein phosphatase PrpC
MTPVALSTDHKVNLPEEQARIEGMGGYVQPEEEDDGDFMPARMYESARNRRLGPGLCVSRALGDLKALKIGLLPTPEVCTHTVSDDDCFLIMASDGVWEFIDNAEAVQIVNQFYSAGRPAMDACRFLIAKAAVLWRKYEGDYRDDITAVVMYLPPVMRILNSEAK